MLLREYSFSASEVRFQLAFFIIIVPCRTRIIRTVILACYVKSRKLTVCFVLSCFCWGQMNKNFLKNEICVNRDKSIGQTEIKWYNKIEKPSFCLTTKTWNPYGFLQKLAFLLFFFEKTSVLLVCKHPDKTSDIMN